MDIFKNIKKKFWTSQPPQEEYAKLTANGGSYIIENSQYSVMTTCSYDEDKIVAMNLEPNQTGTKFHIDPSSNGNWTVTMSTPTSSKLYWVEHDKSLVLRQHENGPPFTEMMFAFEEVKLDKNRTLYRIMSKSPELERVRQSCLQLAKSEEDEWYLQFAEIITPVNQSHMQLWRLRERL